MYSKDWLLGRKHGLAGMRPFAHRRFLSYAWAEKNWDYCSGWAKGHEARREAQRAMALHGFNQKMADAALGVE